MNKELIDKLDKEYEAAKDMVSQVLPIDEDSRENLHALYGSLQRLRDLALKFGESKECQGDLSPAKLKAAAEAHADESSHRNANKNQAFSHGFTIGFRYHQSLIPNHQ